jgi:uncharacterized SAM-binding protein YcdF (DUF218 family)
MLTVIKIKTSNDPMLTRLRNAWFIFCLLCVLSLFFSDGGNATWWVRLVGVLFILVYIILALLLEWQIKKLPRESDQDSANTTNSQFLWLTKTREMMREIFLVVSVFFLIYAGIDLLASWQNAKSVLDSTIDFKAARVEWFIAASAGIAVIGAIWAVWAKIMADKAFHAAQSADDKAYQAYLGVTTKAIQFDQMIANKALLKHINSANARMRLLLGLPQVGFFYKNPKNGELALVDAACELSTKISAKANNILDQGGEVDILFFDKKLCDFVAEKAAVDPLIKTKFLAFYDSFVASLQCSAANVRLKWCGYALAAQRPTVSEFDPGIRIAIVDMGKPNGIKLEKAIIWFVSEFLDDTPTKFRAAALETYDPSLINLMNSLVDYYLEKFNPTPPDQSHPGLKGVPPATTPPVIELPVVPIAPAQAQDVSAPKTESPPAISKKTTDDTSGHSGATHP